MVHWKEEKTFGGIKILSDEDQSKSNELRSYLSFFAKYLSEDGQSDSCSSIGDRLEQRLQASDGIWNETVRDHFLHSTPGLLSLAPDVSGTIVHHQGEDAL